MLAEKTGVHKDQIRLIFKGKPMSDEKVSSEAKRSATRSNGEQWRQWQRRGRFILLHESAIARDESAWHWAAKTG